jgi:hypothetical protein
MFEAKWTSRPGARDATALRGVRAELPPGTVASATIVCRTPNPYPLDDGTRVAAAEDLGP